MPRLVAMHRAGVINVRAQKKLVEAGIHTVEDLLWLTSGGCARSGNVTLLLVFLRVFNSLRCFVVNRRAAEICVLHYSVVERAGMTEGELKEVLTCITRRFAPIPRQAKSGPVLPMSRTPAINH